MNGREDGSIEGGIYRDGDEYDRMYLDDAPAVEFYCRMAGRSSESGAARVLELACGTGKYLVPLAQRGHAVTGVDRSAAMLEAAQRKAGIAGVQLELIEADLRELRLGREFDLVFIAGNSFCHMLTRQDAESCLAAASAHMADGGTFVLDVFVPDARLLVRESEVPYPFSRFRNADGLEVVVTQTSEYDPVTQISNVRVHRKIEGEANARCSHLILKMWYPAELEAILHYNGFRIRERLGSHAGRALSARSGKQILVCERDRTRL